MMPAPRTDPPHTVRTLAGKAVSVAQKVGDDQWLVVGIDREFTPRMVGDAEVSGWHKHSASEQCHDLSVEPWCAARYEIVNGRASARRDQVKVTRNQARPANLPQTCRPALGGQVCPRTVAVSRLIRPPAVPPHRTESRCTGVVLRLM